MLRRVWTHGEAMKTREHSVNNPEEIIWRLSGSPKLGLELAERATMLFSFF